VIPGERGFGVANPAGGDAAGYCGQSGCNLSWVPAFAGMSGQEVVEYLGWRQIPQRRGAG
jgi:hypothetical protein